MKRIIFLIVFGITAILAISILITNPPPSLGTWIIFIFSIIFWFFFLRITLLATSKTFLFPIRGGYIRRLKELKEIFKEKYKIIFDELYGKFAGFENFLEEEEDWKEVERCIMRNFELFKEIYGKPIYGQESEIDLSEIETRLNKMGIFELKKFTEIAEREIWNLKKINNIEELKEKFQEKIKSKGGIRLGLAILGFREKDEYVFEKERLKHTYIVGKTGMGKSTFLLNLILQDIEMGQGAGLISPEKELFRDKLLPRIPRERIDDVIYFEPRENPISFNPFYIDQGEDPNFKGYEIEAILRKLMPTEMSGARMEALLRNCIFTLLERKDSTIFDIEKLLDPNDSSFRDEIIEKSKDERVRKFWQNIYPRFPKDAFLPIITRLDIFFRPPLLDIFSSKEKPLDIAKAMQERKILLFDLSGITDSLANQVLGQLVVSKIQQTMSYRDRIPEKERTPFYLYIDEFQTYTHTATASYSEILSRARKYKIGLILAHQHLGQIPTELLKDILGNVAIKIFFKVSSEDSQRLLKELPYYVGGDEESKRFFLKMAINLGKGEACYYIEREDSYGDYRFDRPGVKLITPLIEKPRDYQIQKEILQKSKEKYGLKFKPEIKKEEKIIEPESFRIKKET